MRLWHEGVQSRYHKGGPDTKRHFSPSDKSWISLLVTQNVPPQPTVAKPGKLPNNAHVRKAVRPVIQNHVTISIDTPQDLLAVVESAARSQLEASAIGLSFVTGTSAGTTEESKRVVLTASVAKRFGNHLVAYGKTLRERLKASIAVNLKDYPGRVFFLFHNNEDHLERE